jgi:hypothetical protein
MAVGIGGPGETKHHISSSWNSKIWFQFGSKKTKLNGTIDRNDVNNSDLIRTQYSCGLQAFYAGFL